jgi:hypothetical protein
MVEVMRNVRFKVLLMLGASLLLLAGCSKMDAAAIVGDVEIPLSTVQTSVDSVITERGEVDTSGMEFPTEEALVQSQAQFHITVVLLDELAKEFGIEISKTDIDAEREYIINQVGGEENLNRALAGAVIAQDDFETYIIASKIYERLGEILVSQGIAQEEVPTAQQALLVKKAGELSVTVNPRYGVWDESTASLQTGGDSNGAVTDK